MSIITEVTFRPCYLILISELNGIYLFKIIIYEIGSKTKGVSMVKRTQVGTMANDTCVGHPTHYTWKIYYKLDTGQSNKNKLLLTLAESLCIQTNLINKV